MKKQFDFRSIKTIKDACEKTGTDFEAFMAMIEPLPENIQALCALQLIIKAINDGWENPLDGDTYVYFPWICVYNDQDRDCIEKTEPARADLIRFSRPVRTAASPVRTRVTPGRTRMRISALALPVKRESWPIMWPATSSTFLPAICCLWRTAGSLRNTPNKTHSHEAEIHREKECQSRAQQDHAQCLVFHECG